MKCAFKVFRFDPTTDEEPYFQEYDLDIAPSSSILEALIEIRDRLDNTLSFRYSCRGAVCGSCSMIINGKPDLACRVQLASIESEQIVLEPLANLEILKDLIVDMDPFWEAYQKVQPYLQPAGEPPETEYRVREKDMESIDPFLNCVLCACCYSACPVATTDENYLGPAALAKLYRFVRDPRDSRGYAALKEVDSQEGVWGCHTVFRCVDACPKDARPVDGIEGVRRKLLIERMKRFFLKR